MKTRKVEILEDNVSGGLITSTGRGIVTTATQPGSNTTYTGAYGVDWDQSSDTYTRTGVDAFTAIQSRMRRCLLNANGSINYYLHPNDSAKKADGSVAVLDGSDGDVMVEIPKFYHKYSFATDVHSHTISLDQIAGSNVHPAFDKNGVEVDSVYIAAYTMNENGRSVSGSYPHCDITRDGARTLCESNGAGWSIQDFSVLSAVQLLMMIEYADFNSQEVIGMGRTQLSGDTWVDGSYYGQAGRSNAVGNGTGNHNYVGDADDSGADAAYMSYRGIEDFYGNVWTFVDGINIQDGVPYLSNNPAGFADDVFTGDYLSVGVQMPTSDGWQNTLANSSKGFFPDTVGASDSTKIGDYYWYASGNRVVLSGAIAADGSYAGASALYAVWAASDSYVSVSARSQYK